MGNTDIRIFSVDEYLPLVKCNNKTDNLSDGSEEQVLEIMLGEDYDENISVERRVKLVKRDLQIVRKLKQRYGCRCQICGHRFKMDNGEHYCEAHHIIPVSEKGNQSSENVIILCANHHRMFHYAKNMISVGTLVDGVRTIQIGNDKYDIQF